MKRILLSIVTAAAFFSGGALAQDYGLDLSVNANVPANTAVISQTRWMPTIEITDLSTASSRWIVAPMGGIIEEIWLVNSTGIQGGNHVNVSISPYLGAMVNIDAAQMIQDTSVERAAGGRMNVRFRARFNKGDSIVISTTGASTGTSVGMVTLRIAN